MNVESRLPAVYPTFHNTQQHRQQQQQPQPTQKEIDIDNSIYQLLSIYLDGNANGILLPPSTQDSKTMMMKQSSYTRIIKKLPTKGQNWLGETKEPVISARTELERNTINNSYTIKVEPGTRITKKSRSKSVSFNETVTVINQDKSVSCSNLMQPSASSSKHDVNEGNSGDEDLFVDAVENSID
ncbi:hypothetical protein [Parasitella parasitica]|uniref:Uncharacterized protein n=1 Tax=Parasitella parasitica TaxID=35722 RepID=A0A0B7NVZ1_9FUNG|nr:hypothetical protein [Parasitella parasitica]